MSLSGSHLCVRMGHTPPWAIKEKKEDEERVGISNSEKREGWKTESEEEKTREKVQKSLGFLVFHFLSKALESCNRRVGFSSL